LPNIYNIKGEYNKSNFEIKINSAEKLMIYLINIAPLELVLEGEFSDKQLYKRITSIFDGKSASG
ncbi:MAG: hypothetical protein FWC82_03675, partial [Firmicutes bacterium]|nr:hypothetical protein [Bacillota bacterium]